MIQFRRQWTVATAAIAGLAFILNHYRIAGLENIQLVRRTPDEIAEREARGETWSTGLLNDLNRLHFPAQTSAPVGAANAPAPRPESNPVAGNGTNLPSAHFPNTNFPSTEPFQPQQGQPQPSSSPLADLGVPLPSATFNSPAAVPTSPTVLPPSGLSEPDLGRLLSFGEKYAIWESKTSSGGGLPSTLVNSAGSIRVASFHVQALGAAKLAKPHVFEMLVRILRRFDVIALQGVQSNRDDIMPLLIERLNQSGRSYDYMVGPRVGRTAPLEQFAFVFDTHRLETDRYQLYSVDDPQDLIAREPLVGWFRTKGVPARDAFTFSLINVRIDPQFADQERQLLPNLATAVQNDGRGEDDWIMLGDFVGGDAELYPMTKAGVRMALVGVPTNVEGTYMLDEILFSGPATVEFNGKVGVYDFLRQYNLSLEQALEVSDHLPIWAEFSALEGSEPGRIAPVTGDIH